MSTTEEIEQTDINYEDILIQLLTERINIDKLSTSTINLKDITIRNTLKVLDIKGAGTIREIAVISASSFNIFIKADGNEVFNKNADFSTLAELSGIVDTITASISGDNKQVSIRNINFTKTILIQINSEETISAENIFCIYDLQPTKDINERICSG